MLRSDVFSPTSPRVWAARGMARPGLGCPDNRVTGDQGGTLRCAILSLDAPDAPLPEAVPSGHEPFPVVGAMAGG